nr:hypothetical protein CFP56_00573 [Quercus suber]
MDRQIRGECSSPLRLYAAQPHHTTSKAESESVPSAATSQAGIVRIRHEFTIAADNSARPIKHHVFTCMTDSVGTAHESKSWMVMCEDIEQLGVLPHEQSVGCITTACDHSCRGSCRHGTEDEKGPHPALSNPLLPHLVLHDVGACSSSRPWNQRLLTAYSYTVIFIILLAMLIITPGTIVYTAIRARAYQYMFMVGGVYILVAIFTIFIYSSRLYTNRTVYAGVGKAYVPVEEGELGKNVRKMIVSQLERSAIVAWEARPRDLVGEVLEAEQQGLLPVETALLGREDYMVGRLIPIDPASPPWGKVQHPGWSSPSQHVDNKNPNVQFADVIKELPNLIEARAVSLAPPTVDASSETLSQTIADPAVVEVLRRPGTMGLRDYITQLTYLSLVDPPSLGQTFLRQYELARFCGRPISERTFAELMATFSILLGGMQELDSVIVKQIRIQTSTHDESSPAAFPKNYRPASSTNSSLPSPVTARTRMTTTPYLQDSSASSSSISQESVVVKGGGALHDPFEARNRDASGSTASFTSVLHHHTPENNARADGLGISPSMESFGSDAGSVLIRREDG